MKPQLWLAEKITRTLRAKPNTSAKELQVYLERLYKIELSYRSVWKAKQRAMKELYGDLANTFRILYSFKPRWRRDLRAIL